MKRQRGRNRNNSNKSHNGNRQMESNGPDTKVRGSATQIHDKYVNLARDAAVSGNRVKAESYRQHAEHYLRLMNAQEAAKQASDAAREARQEAQSSDSKNSDPRNSDSKSNDTKNSDVKASDSKNDDDHDAENNEASRERKGRRYPPRARKSRVDADGANSESVQIDVPEASNDGAERVKVKPVRARSKKVLDVAASDAEAELASSEAVKPKRRRKAPAREIQDVEAISAAE